MKKVSVPVFTALALWAATALCVSCNALGATGSVSGTVLSATTNQPLTNGSVSLSVNGVAWGATAPVDASGGFSFGTVTWSAGVAFCQFTITGTGLVDGSNSGTLADAGTLYETIFRPGSTISGTVTDSLGGNPISGGSVLVYGSGGVALGTAAVDTQGMYRFGGLFPGTYYARTAFPDYLDELWNNIACTNGNCSVTAGTPIIFVDQVSNSIADFQIEPNLIFADDFGG